MTGIILTALIRTATIFGSPILFYMLWLQIGIFVKEVRKEVEEYE